MSAAGASAATDTLTLSDILDGGEGADTISLISSDDGTATAGAQISNIETMLIRNTVNNKTTTHDASSTSGLTAIVANRSLGDVDVTNLSSGASFTMLGNAVVTNGDTAAGYLAAATDANIVLSGGTTAGDVIITGTVLATQTINSIGAANTMEVLTGAASATSTTINAETNLTTGAATNLGATLTITGAGAVDLSTNALEAATTSVVGSGNSGGITAKLSTLVTGTFVGGTGNDVITSGSILTTGTVNAGDGTDTLIMGAANQLNTASLASKYTNFETIRVTDSFAMNLFSGATNVQAAAMNTKSITGLNATQAANVTVLGDQTTSITFALVDATGTADVLTAQIGSGLLATASFDLAGLVVTGFETVNLAATPGSTATAGGNKTVTIASLTGNTLANLNLTGSAFAITAADTTVAVAIDGSDLTGDGAATPLGLAIGATTFVDGSVVTGSAFKDSVILDAGDEGVTMNLGAGADTITADVASMVADGTTDNVFGGGDGTGDTMVVLGTATTLTDNHFTNVSGMEVLTVNASTGATSITTGAAFNAAYASGVTINQSSKADGSAVNYAMGLSNVDTTILLTTAENGSDTTATNILTGSGNDTVTVVAASYIGDAVALNFTVATGSGDDTISVTTGTLADANATASALTITGGTGKDLITKSGTNGNDAQMVATYVIASGDSLATAFDTITGYDVTAAADFADALDFGTVAIATVATTVDSGVILDSSTVAGIVAFDDSSTFTTALVINAVNLADAVGFLAANTATNDVAAFLYDSNGDGANDSTMVYHNNAIDSLVLLVGITGADSIITTNISNGANDIFVS